ncbi:MAG: hypothetical protein ABSG38_16420 [Spirochaetia bacterium]
MKKKAEQLLNLTQFSLAIGLSHQRVGQLLESGKLRRRKDKFFNLNDKKNKAFITARGPDVASSRNIPRPAAPLGSPAAGPKIEPPVPDINRSEIERRKALGQLEKLRIQNQKAVGKLVERAAVFAFASHIGGILNAEFLSLGQRLATDLAAIARKADNDDAAAVAIDAFLQPELYAVVQHMTAATRKFTRQLYDEAGEVAGPVKVTAALAELKVMLDRVIEELNGREAAA